MPLFLMRLMKCMNWEEISCADHADYSTELYTYIQTGSRLIQFLIKKKIIIYYDLSFISFKYLIQFWEYGNVDTYSSNMLLIRKPEQMRHPRNVDRIRRFKSPFNVSLIILISFTNARHTFYGPTDTLKGLRSLGEILFYVKYQ